MDRRTLLTATLASAAAVATPALLQTANAHEDFKIKNGRIKQSVMGWCLKPISNADLARACAKMGLHAMEGISRDTYPLVKELGMQISLVGSHGFKKGPNDKANHKMCKEKLLDGIKVAKEVGSPSVITFTGMSVKDMDPDEQSKNCVDLWKQVIGEAEKQGITLCLEHLNSRDDSHPMKGHPGYFGDDMDQCIELVKAVGSENFKVLFDVYHVQVMNGDVIRRIRQYKDYIGHYHTAGNPGRGELDETQEINYPAVMEVILETGYKGFVAQEFIPTWEDKLASLRHGVRVCDI